MNNIHPTTQIPNAPLSIIVLGASGDLARKKIFPALFSLFCQNRLPEDTRCIGFSRSPFTNEEFREKLAMHLPSNYSDKAPSGQLKRLFLSHCHYVRGYYDSSDSFLDLYNVLRTLESTPETNRIWYMSIPPFLFLDVARTIGDSGMVICGPGKSWSRVVIEKPFGRDRASSDSLVSEMSKIFNERDTYRIDHYLGKEVIQNLMVLRFANLLFEPIWNGRYIKNVHILWKEDIGVEARGRYFDEYGILRDVMQNHLIQILALIAMEQPRLFNAQHVREEKVNVLHSIPPVQLDDLVIGQYARGSTHGETHPGYQEEQYVPEESHTPTYAAAIVHINNERWRNVPFLLNAGKGLDSRKNEIIIQFHGVPANIFCETTDCVPTNKLVIRIQPDEAIYVRIINKVPGLELTLQESTLDLKYATTFEQAIPDAYESLLLDVIRGDKSLFISAEELAASWDIFTPVLHELEKRGIQPVAYPFGSELPSQAAAFASSHGFSLEKG